MKAKDEENSITFNDIWKLLENKDNLRNVAFLSNVLRVLPVSSAPVAVYFLNFYNFLQNCDFCESIFSNFRKNSLDYYTGIYEFITNIYF